MATSDYTSENEIPYGYCQCGCGQKTSISKANDKYRNYVKNEPRKYLMGHANKIGNVKEKITIFWSHVAITADDNKCWEWQGKTNGDWYGYFWWDKNIQHAHRIAWMLPDYIIPNDMEVCHSCDNPICCNPKHLFLGTHQDNMRDMALKQRSAQGEKHGISKLTDTQIIEIRQRYASSSISQRELGLEYGISTSTVGGIVNCKGWTHISSEGINRQSRPSTITKNNSSGFTGVSKRRNKWSAYFSKDGIRYRLGCYTTPEEANEVRLNFIKENFS